jgi:hypothetical protein
MTPYWEFLRWVVYVGAGIGAWRYLPLTVVRLVAAFTRDEQRHRRCMEVLWISSRKSLPPPCCLTVYEPEQAKTDAVSTVD